MRCEIHLRELAITAADRWGQLEQHCERGCVQREPQQ